MIERVVVQGEITSGLAPGICSGRTLWAVTRGKRDLRYFRDAFSCCVGGWRALRLAL